MVDEEDPLASAALVGSAGVCCSGLGRALPIAGHTEGIDEGRRLEHRLCLLRRGVRVKKERRACSHLFPMPMSLDAHVDIASHRASCGIAKRALLRHTRR